MKSKIIHSGCGGEIKTGGSKNQPIYTCKTHGLVNPEEVTTIYQCKICGEWYKEDLGSFEVDENGTYFLCYAHRKINEQN